MNTATITTFVFYLVVLIVLGYAAYRSTKNLSDYILGGRRLGPWVTALSASASDMSGWLLLGLPGAVYLAGLNQFWLVIGLAIGAYFNWLLVAKRLRVASKEADDAITLPDFLAKRFQDKHHVIRVLSALVILVFFTFYVSSGLVGGAILFEKTFGLSYETALYVGALVIMSYTALGGFLAVSWTDLVQGLLMLAALIFIPMLGIQSLGGWDATVNELRETMPLHLDIGKDMTALGLISLMAWGLGYFGQPHILARFMAIKNPEHLGGARRIAMSWMLLSLTGAMITGLVGALYFKASPLANSETVFIALTQALTNPWLGGILLAAILSAIMSTIDSQLLVSSSAITEDFYRRIFRPSASQHELVIVGRLTVLFIALIAVILAKNPDSSILGLVSYAWAGFGAAFGPTLLLALYWPRMSRYGAIAGILVGASTVIVWKQQTGGLFDLYEMVPGWIFATMAIILVSIFESRCCESTPTGKLNEQVSR